MMGKVPRFVEHSAELNDLLGRLPLLPCPHCGKTGNLIGHGLLRGYAESSSERVTRGRRILCSCRGRKRGCGKTVSTLLSRLVRHCIVAAATLWTLFCALAEGLSVEQAADVSDFPLTLRSAYRVTRQLKTQALSFRAWLCARSAPPHSDSRHPLKQVCAHLKLELGPAPFLSPQFRCSVGLL